MNDAVVVLPWDSELFGYKVGRIVPSGLSYPQLKDVLGRAQREEFRLLYWIVHPDDSSSAEAAICAGALHADSKVTFFRGIPKEFMATPFHLISPFQGRVPTPDLIDLALQSGMQSRFKVDPGFSHGEFEKLYLKWIEKSVTGQIAKEVLVFSEHSRELGLLTLGTKQNRTDIGLLAVDKSIRGRSIGKHLLEVAMAMSSSWGFQQIQVNTQLANEGACKFYKSNGFVVESVQDIYHFWL